MQWCLEGTERETYQAGINNSFWSSKGSQQAMYKQILCVVAHITCTVPGNEARLLADAQVHLTHALGFHPGNLLPVDPLSFGLTLAEDPLRHLIEI